MTQHSSKSYVTRSFTHWALGCSPEQVAQILRKHGSVTNFLRTQGYNEADGLFCKSLLSLKIKQAIV